MVSSINMLMEGIRQELNKLMHSKMLTTQRCRKHGLVIQRYPKAIKIAKFSYKAASRRLERLRMAFAMGEKPRAANGEHTENHPLLILQGVHCSSSLRPRAYVYAYKRSHSPATRMGI
eukprot:TRINITY_DN111068_c0_g1_i1.p1 TRINITY_DN111068_c0_g1~~TRINITY_DN111068_c0_g1_i1.p1  ORF type:complete len:118 (-),score=3.19 TRINITY_DN111068_c0_g1_i1:24-377(-)